MLTLEPFKFLPVIYIWHRKASVSWLKADSRSVSLEPNATLVAILVTNIGKFAEKCQKQQFTTTFAGSLNSHRFTHQLIVLYVLANTA